MYIPQTAYTNYPINQISALGIMPALNVGSWLLDELRIIEQRLLVQVRHLFLFAKLKVTITES